MAYTERCKKSGALIFHKTPEEKRLDALEKKVSELEASLVEASKAKEVKNGKLRRVQTK